MLRHISQGDLVPSVVDACADNAIGRALEMVLGIAIPVIKHPTKAKLVGSPPL
jgi:hypothetical protein